MKVLFRNYRAPKGGEVDLVLRDGKVLVFCEVKTRTLPIEGYASLLRQTDRIKGETRKLMRPMLKDKLKNEERSIEEVKQLVYEMKEGMGVSKEQFKHAQVQRDR